METVLAVVIGSLYAAGLYALLSGSLARLVIGLLFLGNATNLLIFTASGLTRSRPALVDVGAMLPRTPHADPLPQAMILTAIVISFAIVAFALVLVQRTYQATGTDDLERIRSTDT